MVNVIKEIIEQAEDRIFKELAILSRDIDDFSEPMKVPQWTDPNRDEYFKERMTGRLSIENLTKNYERKLELESQLKQIANFKYFNHKMLFDGQENSRKKK